MTASLAPLADRYRADIDGLRAIAVLAVIGFHAFPAWVPGGFVGVDIFFVISGYLISTIILTAVNAGRFSFATFYARRIRRIFPALIAVLAACYAAGWFLLYADRFEQLGKHIAGGAGFVANYVLWNEAGYFDADADTKPLLHLWSLGIEEQFYLVWPLMVFVAWKARLNLIALTIAIFILSSYWNVEGIRRDLVGTFYSPWTRFWELTAGSALAAIVTDQHTWLGVKFRALYDGLRSRASVRDAIAIAGLVLAMGAVFGLDRSRHYPGLWALLPVVGAFVMIAAGPEAWLNRTVLSQRVLVGIGLISYPLYLWHWPLLSFARLLTAETPPPAVRAALIAAAFVLAWLTYKLIEIADQVRAEAPLGGAGAVRPDGGVLRGGVLHVRQWRFRRAAAQSHRQGELPAFLRRHAPERHRRAVPPRVRLHGTGRRHREGLDSRGVHRERNGTDPVPLGRLLCVCAGAGHPLAAAAGRCARASHDVRVPPGHRADRSSRFPAAAASGPTITRWRESPI